MDRAEDDNSPLPPRREKHGSKKEHDDVAVTITPNQHRGEKRQAQSFNKMQKEMNSRLARRKAIKEFTLNPQGYRQKSTEPKVQEPSQPMEKRKRKKWSGALIVANMILWLFLLMMTGIFFVVIKYF